MSKTFDEIFVEIDQVGCVIPEEDSLELGRNLKEIFDIPDEGAQDGGVSRHPNSTYRGEKLEVGPAVHMQFFNKFGIQLEYLSPVEGDSAWMDYTKKVGRGLHHIRFNVSSHDDAIAYMAEKGIPVYQSGDSVRGGGVKFAYFDSYDKLGFYIETLNLEEVARKNK